MDIDKTLYPRPIATPCYKCSWPLDEMDITNHPHFVNAYNYFCKRCSFDGISIYNSLNATVECVNCKKTKLKFGILQCEHYVCQDCFLNVPYYYLHVCLSIKKQKNESCDSPVESNSPLYESPRENSPIVTTTKNDSHLKTDVKEPHKVVKEPHKVIKEPHKAIKEHNYNEKPTQIKNLPPRCPSCLNILEKNDMKQVHYLTNTYDYHCEKCFFVGSNVIKSFNIDENCCFCNVESTVFDVLKCGHAICHFCFKRLQYLSSDPSTEKKYIVITCPLCKERVKTDEFNISYCTREKSFDVFPKNIRKNMFELYSRYFCLKIHSSTTGVNQKKNIKTHKVLYNTLYQYFTWLRILATDENRAMTMYPGFKIYELWILHMSSTKSYLETCIQIAGKFLHSYLETRDCNNDGRCSGRLQLLKLLTEISVEKADILTQWMFCSEFKNQDLLDGGYILIKMLPDSPLILNISDDSTLNSVCEDIKKATGVTRFKLILNNNVIATSTLIELKKLSTVGVYDECILDFIKF